MLLGINLDDLNNNQTNMAKNILLNNEFITGKEDTDLDLNILEDKFDCEFSSG